MSTLNVNAVFYFNLFLISDVLFALVLKTNKRWFFMCAQISPLDFSEEQKSEQRIVCMITGKSTCWKKISFICAIYYQAHFSLLFLKEKQSVQSIEKGVLLAENEIKWLIC